MKTKRILFLAMSKCLASGAKAQFYDSADEICYYVLYESERNDSRFGHEKSATLPQHVTVYVFNFDGKKAAELNTYGSGDDLGLVKRNLSFNPTHYDEKVETAVYDFEYDSTTGGEITYVRPIENTGKDKITFRFSRDRNMLQRIYEYKKSYYSLSEGCEIMRYKRVDKSYFKTGRSRTPSSGMYE